MRVFVLVLLLFVTLFARFSFLQLQNPFVKKQALKPIISLEAIIGDKAKLNGHWVEEGGSFEGFTLIKILKQGVLVQGKGKKLRISL